MDNNKQKNFFVSFTTISIGTIVNMIIGFISTPIITRLVIPEEYGKLSIFTLYISIATMVLCLGLDQALLRFFYNSENPNYRKSLYFVCFVLPTSVTVLLSVVFYCLVRMMVIPFEFADIVEIFVVGVVSELINRFSLVLLRLINKGTQYAIACIIHKVIYVVLAILFATLGYVTFIWLGIATVIAYISSTAYAFFSSREFWGYQKNDSYFQIGELISYGAPFVLSSGLSVLFSSIDKMCLKQMCDYSVVGVYSSALTLIGVFAIIQTSFNTIWAPVMVEHYEKSPDDKNFYTQYNSMITFVLFVFGLCFILFKDVFGLLLGEKYREAAFIIPFLSFHPIMYTISETTVTGIVVKKKSYLHAIIAFISCIVNLIGNLCLIPYLGAKGAAISTGLSYVVFYVLRTVFGNKLYFFDHGAVRFWISTLILIMFSFYATFCHTSALSVVFFVISISVVCFIYRTNIHIIVIFVSTVIRKKKWR